MFQYIQPTAGQEESTAIFCVGSFFYVSNQANFIHPIQQLQQHKTRPEPLCISITPNGDSISSSISPVTGNLPETHISSALSPSFQASKLTSVSCTYGHASSPTVRPAKRRGPPTGARARHASSQSAPEVASNSKFILSSSPSSSPQESRFSTSFKSSNQSICLQLPPLHLLPAHPPTPPLPLPPPPPPPPMPPRLSPPSLTEIRIDLPRLIPSLSTLTSKDDDLKAIRGSENQTFDLLLRLPNGVLSQDSLSHPPQNDQLDSLRQRKMLTVQTASGVDSSRASPVSLEANRGAVTWPVTQTDMPDRINQKRNCVRGRRRMSEAKRVNDLGTENEEEGAVSSDTAGLARPGRRKRRRLEPFISLRLPGKEGVKPEEVNVEEERNEASEKSCDEATDQQTSYDSSSGQSLSFTWQVNGK
ncbi:unnamed protein product, partial [Protopolystoma xenopodis]